MAGFQKTKTELFMSMTRLFKRVWGASEVATAGVDGREGQSGRSFNPLEGDPASNVFPIPVGLETGGAGGAFHDVESSPKPASAYRFIGLTNAPELTSFFEENFFAYGRHAGANNRSQEALQLGRQEQIAKFQNRLNDLAERKQAKVNRLMSEMIAIDGVSPSISAQLRLAKEQLEREIVQLRDQMDLAAEGKGWILEALNRYQIGFLKGLQTVIDFELLAG